MSSHLVTPLGKSTTGIQYMAPKFDYHEDTHSFIPHESTPSSGTTHKCTIQFSTHRRLIEDLILNFKIKNTHSGSITLVHPVNLIEQVIIFINNIEILKHDYGDATFLSFIKTLYANSFDSQDVKNNFYNVISSLEIGAGSSVECFIPLDSLVSDLFNRFDSLQAKSITIELKWKSDTTQNAVCKFLSTATDINNNPYPKLQIENMNLIQKAVSYKSAHPYPTLGEPYVKQIFKFEKKQYQVDNNGEFKVRLADDFGQHGLIIGVFVLNTQSFSNYSGIPSKTTLDLGCKLYQNGRLIKNTESAREFWKQSDQFYKSIGSKTSTDFSLTTPYASYPVFNFLDKHIHNVSKHDSNHMEFFGGITNTKNNNYELQFIRYNRGITLTNSVDVYICYLEMLTITNGAPRVIH